MGELNCYRKFHLPDLVVASVELGGAIVEGSTKVAAIVVLLAIVAHNLFEGTQSFGVKISGLAAEEGFEGTR